MHARTTMHEIKQLTCAFKISSSARSVAFPHTGSKPLDSVDVFVRFLSIFFAMTMGGSLADEAGDELLAIC